MKSLLSVVSILLFLHASAQPDTTLVKDCFNKYKEAVLNDKGAAAYSVLDKKTIVYYNELLEKVKTYDSLKLEKESIINKVTILTMRHRATKEEIMKMTGETLFIYAIDKGMIGKNSVSNSSVGKVTITGDFAKGGMQVNGRDLPASYDFYKEDGTWKFNLTSLFALGNMGFKRLVEQSGMSENEAIFSMLETVSGTKPSQSIWNPLVK